jgi:hypothetical protein
MVPAKSKDVLIKEYMNLGILFEISFTKDDEMDTII